jgi:aspartyl-tRNA(Asn)/glutamyl-tRNA(Gln) amidotransferase subunit C
MSLTLSEVEHIAILARLNLTDAEKIKYQQQLSSILDYAVMLQELDTSTIPPTSGVLPVQCPLRTDSPMDSLPTSELLRNAPETAKDQFRVPPVFE